MSTAIELLKKCRLYLEANNGPYHLIEEIKTELAKPEPEPEPPVRKELSVEEIKALADEIFNYDSGIDDDAFIFARTIEKALREGS